MPTKAELQEQLDELGIDYDPSSTKAVLESLLQHPSVSPPPSPSDPARPVWEAGESRSEYHARYRAWKRSR
jgi:hypothetical protein